MERNMLTTKKRPPARPVPERETTPATLQSVYAPIEEELAQVEQILRTELRSPHDFVDELVRYGCLLGGKRLRPALLLLSAKACGQVRRDHLVLAAVVEMIHTATLVHDDVLDEADMRRHLATVNARWSNEVSVLLGDYLFTHAFYLASTLETTRACRLIGRATNIVCEGELRQIGSRGNFSLTEAEYLDIIEAKTAELCACACELGAHYAGADGATVERLTRFGRDLGIAFQIADDLLDVQGDERATGKSLGTDLDQHKPTLPLIRVFELATPAERQELQDLMLADSEPRRRGLCDWYVRCGALEYSRSRALSFARSAREALDPLPSSPSLDVLRMLSELVVLRSH
jgi:octaprenyl-diphosphate synthase